MTQTAQAVPLHLIDPPLHPSRVKISPAYIEELASSIRSLGLIHPITIKQIGERYEVTAGHCRYLAHQLMGETMIMAHISDAPPEKQEAIKAVENMTREQLTPLEEARNLLNMHRNMDLSVPQISHLTGKSESWVRQRLDMLNWPMNVLEQIQLKNITLAVGRQLVKVDDEEYRNYLLHEAAKNGITEYTAAAWVQSWIAERSTPEVQDIIVPPRPPSQAGDLEIRMPCFRCHQPTVIGKMSIVRICFDCYNEVS